MQPEHLSSVDLVDPTTPNPPLSPAAAAAAAAAAASSTPSHGAVHGTTEALQNAKEPSLIRRSESSQNLSSQSPALTKKRSRIPRPHSFCSKTPSGRLSSPKPDLLPDSTPKRHAFVGSSSSRGVERLRQDAVRRHNSLGCGERPVRRTQSALPKMDANSYNERRKSLPIETLSNASESHVVDVIKENLENMSRLENNVSTETLIIVGRDDPCPLSSPEPRLSNPAKPTRKVVFQSCSCASHVSVDSHRTLVFYYLVLYKFLHAM